MHRVLRRYGRLHDGSQPMVPYAREGARTINPMEIPVPLELADIPMAHVLMGEEDSALATALRELKQRAEDGPDEYEVAGFSNFV